MTDILNDPLPSPAVDGQEDDYDPEMVQVLQAMLDEDEDITARGVIRRHSSLNAASSITRNKARMAVLERFRAKQDEFRGWRKRLAKGSRDTAAMGLADTGAGRTLRGATATSLGVSAGTVVAGYTYLDTAMRPNVYFRCQHYYDADSMKPAYGTCTARWASAAKATLQKDPKDQDCDANPCVMDGACTLK